MGCLLRFRVCTGTPDHERPAREEPEPDTVVGEPSEASGRLDTEPESAPPRHQDIHGRETGGRGLSAEEEAVRTVDEDEDEA